MIGTRVEVVYQDGVAPAEVVEISPYAVGRVALWCRKNGIQPSDIEPGEGSSMSDVVLYIQLCCWAEKTRGMGQSPPDFDKWAAKVADFNPVESPEVDPTQPAT